MWDLPPLEEFGVESWGLVVASPWPVMVRGCPGQAQSGACIGDTASQVGAQPGPQLDVQLCVIRWLQAGFCAEG